MANGRPVASSATRSVITSSQRTTLPFLCSFFQIKSGTTELNNQHIMSEPNKQEGTFLYIALA
jgi:hypothetical protein